MDYPQYGLVGRHLSHSFSPEIHNKLSGIDYGLFQIEPENLENFILNKDYSGLNITIPYKKSVIPYCDALTPQAERIGSVNTILHQPDGSLLGHNTDYDGFLYLLKQANAQIAGKKCLILGNGGVSPTVRVALEDANAREIIIISRAGEHNYQNLDLHADAEIIINTTPVGMYPNTLISPLDLSQFPQCCGVYDLIYNPANTQLMLDSQDLGISTAGGLSMLVAQAAAADELFLDKPIPPQKVDDLTGSMAKDTKNIILIGMPGCGKSTVGRHLAIQLGRQFLDTDTLIQKKIGMGIPEFFEKFGQEKFRQVEHEILVEVSRESGKVIATGGGIVTRPENHHPLRQNSTIIFLQRELSQLATQGRPVSQAVPLEKLYAQRLPLYRQLCDFEVDCGTSVRQTIATIMEVQNP